MSEFQLPWLALAIVVPLVGAAWVARIRSPRTVSNWSLLFSGVSLAAAVGAWLDFTAMHNSPAPIFEGIDRWQIGTRLLGMELFKIDQLSAPLLPLVALLYFLTILATLRTKLRRFSFTWCLVSQALALATFSCKEPWGVIGLLSAGTLLPYLELCARHKSTRLYVMHMGLFVFLLVVGWALVENSGSQRPRSLWVFLPLLGAVLVRCGMAPFHCWVADLFEKASFGSALLFVTPIAGAYAMIRLVIPVCPDWLLRSVGLVSILTAVYAAGMSLIQKDARRFFSYQFISHSALVLAGLQMVTPTGLSGSLYLWLSVGLSLVGFGLTLRALEARRGRLSLTEFQGLYEHTPALAICFILTGLASVGFPGTLGFVGAELLVHGVVETYPYIGVAVVAASALNGIAMVRAYFILFTGTRYSSSVSLQIGLRERLAVLALTALVLIGGLYPHPGIASRYHAAEELLEHREAGLSDKPAAGSPAH
ncbi:MAG: proton-conducting transporter membrane subunit [Pirellulaceae bacterium]